MDGQYLPDDEIDIDSLASSEPPEYVPQMFSEGGEVEEEDIEYYAKGGEASLDSQTEAMNKYLLADEADTAYAPMYPNESKASEGNTKTAKLMLKKLSTKSGGGKSKRSKEMSLEMGDLSPAIPELGAPPTEQEKLTQIASARSQYDALEQAYKLKAQAAQRAGKGLMRPTFNTAMFDQPTLERPGPLMAKTFAKGGEADKEDLPGLYGVSDYAREESANMFPEEKGQWDRQDSARHMLAAATLARKYGPRTAELAGQAHELMASPIRFIGSKMGVMKESPDYAQDIHNNRLGIELASKSKSQEELLALVRQMALQAREGQTPGKASTGKPTGASDSVGRYGSQGPVKPVKMAAGGTPTVQTNRLPFAPTAMVRPSTRAELEKIKAEYAAYEPKAAEYNAALEKYKAEQLNPYQTQVDAYNAALAKYNTETYNPYQAAVDKYNADLEAWNQKEAKQIAELRKSGPAGGISYTIEPNPYPGAVPVAPKDFGMAVPTAPGQFSMTAPAAPAVSPQDYKAKMAAAKTDTANRQLALNVAMDPEAYGLSMPKLFANGGPVYRAEGSPASGERLTPQQIEQLAADQAALNQYYAPKARPSTGMNRQKGPISKQLDTGEAYVNMAKGVTELPYDLLGAPRDISNMIMTPFGYGVKDPVMGSDWIKAQMTKRGIRPEPPADSTAKGFYTAGELLSNLTNPAGVARKVGPVVEKGVAAVGKEAARQVERGVFNEGPLRGITPQPMYISRPPGGYFPTSRGMAEKTVEEINNTKLSDLPENFVSWLNTDDKQKASFLGLGPKRESLGDKYNRWKAETGSKDYTFGILSGVDKSFQPILKKITEMESGEKRDALFQMFNQKAKDFYSKQAGSIQDPLRADILGGNIKFDMDSKMGDVFPKTLVKSAAQGDLQALRLLEKNYDDMIGVKAVVPYRRVPSRPDDIPPPNTLKRQIIESVRDNLDSIPDSQLLAYAGKKPLPGPDGVAKAAKEVRLKLKENPNLFSTVLEPNIERTVFAKESRYSDLDLAKYPSLYGTTATEAMINPQGPAFTKDQFEAMDALPQGYFLPELETAINKSQPMLDAQEYGNLKLLGLTTDKLLQEANRLSAKDLNSMGFTDFLKKAYKSSEEVAQLEKDLKRVKPLLQQGKPPPANVMLFGVKDFLPTVNDMRWVKVTNPDGVKSIAAGMNNSVGSYATSETYGALGRGRRALDKGEIEVYALYDKNHVPHVTVEYGTGKSSVPEKQRSQILQLTGNGPLTVNDSSSNYAEQIAALVNALPIKDVTALPASTQKILKNNFFEFKDNRVVRNEEEFSKFQETKKELGLAKGGSVDKNTAFIKAHT